MARTTLCPTFRYCIRWDLEDFVEDFDLWHSVLRRRYAVLPTELSQDGGRLPCITPHIITITAKSHVEVQVNISSIQPREETVLKVHNSSTDVSKFCYWCVILLFLVTFLNKDLFYSKFTKIYVIFTPIQRKKWYPWIDTRFSHMRISQMPLFWTQETLEICFRNFPCDLALVLTCHSKVRHRSRLCGGCRTGSPGQSVSPQWHRQPRPYRGPSLW